MPSLNRTSSKIDFPLCGTVRLKKNSQNQTELSLVTELASDVSRTVDLCHRIIALRNRSRSSAVC